MKFITFAGIIATAVLAVLKLTSAVSIGWLAVFSPVIVVAGLWAAILVVALIIAVVIAIVGVVASATASPSKPADLLSAKRTRR